MQNAYLIFSHYHLFSNGILPWFRLVFPFNLTIIYNNWLFTKGSLKSSVPTSMQEFFNILHNFLNYSCNLDACISFGSYVYIHYQFFNWFILLGFFVIFYFSSNVLLFLIHNTQWFQVMFYCKGNEMKKLGYHLWQISQNVMLVLRLINSLILQLTYAFS
jgi:hypothetical protein